jgi:predicted transglutaminase-like cysteine proteinase
MDTEPVFGGDILEKWSRAKAEIARELETVVRCRANKPCPTAAQRLMDLSAEGAGRSGRARVGLINRAVDQAISPISDEAQWGVPDHWSAPFETLRSGRGDCEDYAIVKYLALLDAGIPENDVKIVVLKNVFPIEDHAVLAARVDGDWLILDNRTLTLVRDRDLTRAVPEFVLDQGGVRRFVSRSRSRRPIERVCPPQNKETRERCNNEFAFGDLYGIVTIPRTSVRRTDKVLC